MGYDRLFSAGFDHNTEGWLASVITDIEAHRKPLEKSGVYTFAQRVLCSAECRDIPEPETAVTKDGCYLIDWKLPNGARLFLSFGSPIQFKYALTESHEALGSLRICRKDYADTLRGLLEKVFTVNSASAESVKNGEWE
jgi:hypothetical protein